MHSIYDNQNKELLKRRMAKGGPGSGRYPKGSKDEISDEEKGVREGKPRDVAPGDKAEESKVKQFEEKPKYDAAKEEAIEKKHEELVNGVHSTATSGDYSYEVRIDKSGGSTDIRLSSDKGLAMGSLRVTVQHPAMKYGRDVYSPARISHSSDAYATPRQARKAADMLSHAADYTEKLNRAFNIQSEN